MQPRRWVLLFCLLCLWSLARAGGAGQDQPEDVMVQTYRRAIEIDPQDVIAHFNLGLALYKQEEFEPAKEALNKALAINRGDRRAHEQIDGPAQQLLGIIYYNVDRDDRRAVDAFRRSLQRQPKDPETYYFLGLAYQHQKNLPQALRAFDQALELGQANADIFFQRGQILGEMGRTAEAVDSYRQGLKLEPDSLRILESLALLYHRRQDDAQLVPILQHIVRLDPNNFNANYLLGLHYFQKKMYPEMVEAYNRVIAVQPDLADAHFNLGMAYYYQTRYEQAVAELKKAAALNPKDAEAYNLLGQAQTAAIENYLLQGGTYLAQEKYHQAITELQKVFTIDPQNSRAKGLLAEAERSLREEFARHLREAERFYQEKKLGEAYNEYEQAAALDPASEAAQEGIRRTQGELRVRLSRLMKKAQGAERLGDYSEVFAAYDAILQLKPGDPEATAARAALARRLRQETDQLLRQAADFLKNDKPVSAASRYKKALNLAEVLEDGPRKSRSLDGLGLANARKEEIIATYLSQGKKAYGSGDLKRAKEAFNLVLELNPGNATANQYFEKMTGVQSEAKLNAEDIKATYYRGVDLYVNGKIEDAIQEWEKVKKVENPFQNDAENNINRAKAKLAAIRKLAEGN